MPLKTSLLQTAARVGVPAAAALVLTMTLACPASASPAFVAVINGRLTFTALPGETNTVTFDDFSAGTIRVTDTTSNLTAGTGCNGSGSSHTVVCAGAVDGVTRIVANLGDRNDTAQNDTDLPSDLAGGQGNDILVGGPGPDRLTDPDGWNTVPLLTLTMAGRGGNDTIISRNGGFDHVDCGTNFDIVVADRTDRDFVEPGCEFVQRF
ncbi:hypothetical protein EF912_21640 [Streptomyces sp. WAC07061]|uniref:hypothetical protein n=1 Tax=Streptomyces sp. WAC07061 TaxID=2487410 RepID=UPI000F797687|nr:hypothetical protein [Streptomyces sp. WAC07061]RSS50698.1 hypothetical protein EF912_21640 [Streptomyces sp. WAC07061]